MNANKKADQEDLRAKLEAKMDANQKKTDDSQQRMDVNLKEIREDIKSGQAEMRSIVEAIEEKMDAWIADIKNDGKETMACQDAMEATLKKVEQNPGEKEAVVEWWQEIPNEEVAIHSLRAC
jgi:hypothetical protein